MQDFPKLQKQYDHIIIGYNLASMSFAYELSKQNQNFVVIDAKHLGSSPIKRLASLEKRVSTRISFTPNFEEDDNETPIWGEITKHEGTPTTFDKGEFKSFLGFGEKKIQSLDAVSTYCSVENYVPQLTAEEYWNKILENTENKIFLDQQVTDIEYNEEAVSKVVLNGKTNLTGKNFYFFDHFEFLYERMASEMKKQASQFAKAKWHSSVNLIIHHNQEPEAWNSDEIYLLMGSKEQPCLGQFTRVNGELVSRWESFFPSELTADDEMTGMMVKEIKKQIKRAFKFPEGTKDYEHILVQDRVYANFEKLTVENGSLSHFANLFAFSPLFELKTGWMQEIRTGIQAAQSVLEGTSILSASDSPVAPE